MGSFGIFPFGAKRRAAGGPAAAMRVGGQRLLTLNYHSNPVRPAMEAAKYWEGKEIQARGVRTTDGAVRERGGSQARERIRILVALTIWFMVSEIRPCILAQVGQAGLAGRPLCPTTCTTTDQPRAGASPMGVS